MKIVIRSIQISILSFILLATPVLGSEFDFRFHLVIEQEKSTLTIEQVFPAHISLMDVINVLSDLELKPKFGIATVKVYREGLSKEDLEAYLLDEPAKDLQSDIYRLLTVGKPPALNLKAIAAMICTESSAATQWVQDCSADLHREQTRIIFKTAQTKTICGLRGKDQHVYCETVIQVRPRPIYIPIIFERNEQQLALSGAAESIRVVGKSYLYLLEGPNAQVESVHASFEASSLNGAVNKLDELWAQAKDDQYKEGRLDVTGTLSSSSVTVYYDPSIK